MNINVFLLFSSFVFLQIVCVCVCVCERERERVYKIGLAVRVFANGPGDQGSIPGRVIPKTKKKKNGT